MVIIEYYALDITVCAALLHHWELTAASKRRRDVKTEAEVMWPQAKQHWAATRKQKRRGTNSPCTSQGLQLC